MRIARSLLVLAALAIGVTTSGAAPAARTDTVAASVSHAFTPSAMPTPITFYPSYEAAVAVHGDELPVGTMYPDSDLVGRRPHGKSMLSPSYHANVAESRAPLVVVVPDGTHFAIDSVFVRDGVPGDAGWDVTGEPPNVTLSPSVNISSGWHGFIRDGVISDDVEGKSFDYPKRR